MCASGCLCVSLCDSVQCVETETDRPADRQTGRKMDKQMREKCPHGGA